MRKEIRDMLPVWIYSSIATCYWFFHPGRPPRLIYPHNGHWRVRNFEKAGPELLCVPNRGLVSRASPATHASKIKRYTLEGFSDVKAGDFVLDVGAFVGEFSIPASKKAKSVVAIEPDKGSFNCINHNVENRKNVSVRKELLWSDNTMLSFKVGKDPTDNSIINIDGGKTIEEREVKAKCIDSIMNNVEVQEIDFLKMDVEGAEPQVLEGAENTRIKKCAIDCSKEKKGESTKKEVVEILNEWGLEVRADIEGHEGIVFGRKR